MFIGFILIAVAFIVDLFFNGTPGYGWKQLICLLSGSYAVILGIRMLSFKNQKTFDLLFLISCIAGVLILGLKPESYGLDYSYEMFSYYQFSTFDFIINFFGFLPIGYLITALNFDYYTLNLRIMMILVGFFGFILSLIIEVSQFLFITSRVASIYDILANSFGAISGYVLYVILGEWEHKIRKRL